MWKWKPLKKKIKNRKRNKQTTKFAEQHYTEAKDPNCSSRDTNIILLQVVLTGLINSRLRVVSNFGDGDYEAGKIHTRAREISRRRDAKGARVYFARPTITIAKIRDYSQSKLRDTLNKSTNPPT